MKAGLRFVDCDMHIMEPPDLFERYLDPKFKDRVILPVGAHSPRRRWVAKWGHTSCKEGRTWITPSFPARTPQCGIPWGPWTKAEPTFFRRSQAQKVSGLLPLHHMKTS